MKRRRYRNPTFGERPGTPAARDKTPGVAPSFSGSSSLSSCKRLVSSLLAICTFVISCSFITSPIRNGQNTPDRPFGSFLAGSLFLEKIFKRLPGFSRLDIPRHFKPLVLLIAISISPTGSLSRSRA